MHILDHPIWHALTTTHANIAWGNDLARLYPSEISPLGAIREQSAEAYTALTQLLDHEETIGLFLNAQPEPSADLQLVTVIPVEQMVCESLASLPSQDIAIDELHEDDVPEMVELATLTQPGPFRHGTIQFGGYRGIREGGKLLAMAGQRLAPAGFREVSAVCTHPDARGRGYAGALVSAVASGIAERGETPFLHVRYDNANAIRLYEKLGFRTRQRLYVALLKKP